MAAEERIAQTQVDEDVDNYTGFPDNHSRFGVHEEETYEKLMEAFFSRDARPQLKLADIIFAGRKTLKERKKASTFID